MSNKVYVGWDSREDIAYQVCKHSLLTFNNKVDVNALKLNELKDIGLVTRPADQKASTEFTFTRFLVPYLNNYKGWALFVDCDFLFCEDVDHLFNLADDRYAVMVVQHDYNVVDGAIKMDGKVQHSYPRKNWSSCILFNCSHPKNQEHLKPETINQKEMSYLHRFSWLDDNEIGSLPFRWNWLVGHYTKSNELPGAIHYTLGTPFMPGYENCDYADLWFNMRDRYYKDKFKL